MEEDEVVEYACDTSIEEYEEEESYSIDKFLLDNVFQQFIGSRDNNGYFDGSHCFLLFEHEYELIPSHTSPKDNGETEEHKKYGFEYIGSCSKGLMDGKGLIKWNNGQTYEGDLKESKLNGNGKFVWIDGSSYEGQVQNGLRHGKGRFIHAGTGSTYDGDWKYGKRNGRGTLFYNSSKNEVYEGDFFQNMRHGIGHMFYSTGNEYHGEWYEDKIHGYGVMYWYTSSEKYEGYWKDNQPNGEGKLTYYNLDNETCNYYEGNFIDGKREGYGVFYYADGSRYKGQWSNNQKHGIGEYCTPSGVIQRSIFENDRIVKNFPEEEISVDKNPTYVPLYIQDILVKYGTLDDINHIQRLVSRCFQRLKQVFSYYCKYGIPGETLRAYVSNPTASQTNSTRVASIEFEEKTLIVSKKNNMTFSQFWKFAEDYNLTSHEKLSFAAINNAFYMAKKKRGELAIPKIHNSKAIEDKENLINNKNTLEIEKEIMITQKQKNIEEQKMKTIDNQDFNKKIRFRAFVEVLIRIAPLMYSSSGLTLYEQIQKLLDKLSVQ
jgi:hypothetical protein